MVIDQVKIKVATIQDAAILAQLGKKTFLQTYGSHNTKENMDLYVKRSFSKKILKDELADVTNFYLMADLDGKAVGYAKLTENNKPFHDKKIKAVELERIYVLQEHQGQNIGSDLMQQCLNFAKIRHYKVIWLGVWEKNPKAAGFYQKWHFKTFGSHNFELGKDMQTDVLMKRDLTD
ncbi:MAG: GNAT family N-acetyltransferase, partial [Cyclobacteriaceae bacterium]